MSRLLQKRFCFFKNKKEERFLLTLRNKVQAVSLETQLTRQEEKDPLFQRDKDKFQQQKIVMDALHLEMTEYKKKKKDLHQKMDEEPGNHMLLKDQIGKINEKMKKV